MQNIPDGFEQIDGLKPGDMSRLNLSWRQKLKLKFFPMQWMKSFAKNNGIDEKTFGKLHEGFLDTQRVDLIPLSASRGFMIILDGKTSFWFFQDGDHFKYDGFEAGEYSKGDVTIFDNLNK